VPFYFGICNVKFIKLNSIGLWLKLPLQLAIVSIKYKKKIALFAVQCQGMKQRGHYYTLANIKDIKQLKMNQSGKRILNM